MTISTSQLWTMGLVSLLILVALAAAIIAFCDTFFIKPIALLLVIGFLFGCWTQRDEITQSVKNCKPHFLFIRIKIDDPHTKKVCRLANKAGKSAGETFDH